MATSFDTNFSPAAVMMRQGNSTGKPYVGNDMLNVQEGKGSQFGNPIGQPPTSAILAPQAVRATGSGPFDSAYRQNLATYGGGMYSRPNGQMNFNPTDLSSFPGQPTGGGNAPVAGMPFSMLDMALGGQPFAFSPQQPNPQPSIQPNPDINNLQNWMQKFWQMGRGQRAIA